MGQRHASQVLHQWTTRLHPLLCISTLCRVPVTLANGPAAAEFVEMPRHAKYPPAGTKQQMRSSTLWIDQADAQVGPGGPGLAPGCTA